MSQWSTINSLICHNETKWIHEYVTMKHKAYMHTPGAQRIQEYARSTIDSRIRHTDDSGIGNVFLPSGRSWVFALLSHHNHHQHEKFCPGHPPALVTPLVNWTQCKRKESQKLTAEAKSGISQPAIVNTHSHVRYMHCDYLFMLQMGKWFDGRQARDGLCRACFQPVQLGRLERPAMTAWDTMMGMDFFVFFRIKFRKLKST